ncbi:MAG: lamin tail domain-containing protein [Muribaculaceae bacterium]|nr:lamin tail domain-containing protein [Muribaculaceae bacterium]
MDNTIRTLLTATILAAGILTSSAHHSWVELYNPGPNEESLSDYSIGTKEKASKAYQLPAGSIPAGKYMVIYCDKAAQGRHTDFRLESGKDGAVYLFKGEDIVDRLVGLKKQPAPNIAYGRETDNADKWGYQAVPTPGKTNCGSLCKDILGQPVFSHPGKVSSETFDLSLSLP